jgi:hypothetical protein
LKKALSMFAGRRGSELAAVFVDEGVAGTARDRNGFIALLEALTGTAVDGVLIPGPRRLSDDPEVREFLTRQLERAGTSVYVMASPAAAPATPGPLYSRSCGWRSSG